MSTPALQRGARRVTTALGQLVYVNTIQNTGKRNDTFTIECPNCPAGFTVEVSTDGGGGATRQFRVADRLSLAVCLRCFGDINVRITEPAGQNCPKPVRYGRSRDVGNTPASNNQTTIVSTPGLSSWTRRSRLPNATGVGWSD